MYNHNKAQQSKNRVHISWDILYFLKESHNRYIQNFPSVTEALNDATLSTWADAKSTTTLDQTSK